MFTHWTSHYGGSPLSRQTKEKSQTGFDLTAIKQQSAAGPLGFAQRLQGDTDVASLSECAARLRFCPNTLIV